MEDAEDAYASDVSPEDGFEEDPEDAGSMVSYYWNKIRDFFVAVFGTIAAVFQGKFHDSEDSSKKPSRFVQYLATLSLKIQQYQNNAKSAPARDAEELGPELTADKASRYYGSQIKFTKMRLRIAAVLCLLLAYISFGLPVPGRLHNSVVMASACLALEISVVMCCLDIFTAGIMDLIRKRPNANTLISLSCILSAVDAIVISMSGKTGMGLPYCGISAIAITCALWGSLLYCRGNRITLRTLALSKDPYAITAETDIGGYSDITLLKTKTSTENFVRRTEEMARVLCEKGKELFRTPCNTDIFPSRKEQLLRAIGKARFIGKKNREIIAQFARTIPEEKTCVHGDFSMANIIVSEGNYYWIDLDRFGYGDPMFDIGHLFQICNVYSSMKQVQDIFHMSEEQLKRFWTAFAKAYTGEETPEAFNRLAGKFACLDLVVRNEFQKPSLVESLFFASYIRNHVKNYF